MLCAITARASKNDYCMNICAVSKVPVLQIFYGSPASNCDAVLQLHNWLVRETNGGLIVSQDVKSHCVSVIFSYPKTRK